jgi:hypothetical protein
MKYYDIERLKDFNRVYTFMLRKRDLRKERKNEILSCLKGVSNNEEKYII